MYSEDTLPPSQEEIQAAIDMQAHGQWPTPGEPDPQAAAEQARAERLQMFGLTLARLRDDWVRARTAMGVDRRWAEDQDQYNGEDNATRRALSMMETVEAGGPMRPAGMQIGTRSTIFVNLTRMKTNAGEAHLSDIVLPTDEKNWAIKPTPNASIAKELSDYSPALDESGQQLHGPKLDLNGNAAPEPGQQEPERVPYKKRDIALAVQKMADEAAEGMTREIDDQHKECDYLAELRKVMHDAAVLGTGVLRGPVVTARTRKAWVPAGQDSQGKTVYQLKIVETRTPASFRVDPRFVWPDPLCGDDVQNGRGVIELEEMTGKRVRDLQDQPGYMIDQLARVLMMGPAPSQSYVEACQQLRQGKEITKEPLYQVWTYTGDIDVEDLIAARVPGLRVPDTAEERALMRVSGEVTMINDVVVRANLNPLETGDLPYDFFQWELVADTVWGYGVPYLMRAQQRVLNSAWRQMMDNSAVTVMPQIVLRRGAINPQSQNDYSIWGGKVWFANEDVVDVEKAFMTFDIPNHQERLEKIIAMAEDLADKETGQPQLAQGEQGSAPETVGGMQMLMNATNVVRRRQVKNFDDRITKRHIRRYYDFNMAHSDKEEIKGDFMVDARGSSALLVRDIQNQAFLGLLQTATNPMYEKYTDMKKLYEKALQAQHIQPQDIMKSDDQVEREEEAAKQNPPPVDPRIEAAKLNNQGRVEVAKANAEARAGEAQAEMQLRREITQMEHQIAMMKLAHDKGLTLDQIKAQLATTAMTLRAQDRRQEQAAKFHADTGEAIQ